jgi:hypothetical protein
VVYCEEVESPATALRFDPVLSILYVGFEDGYANVLPLLH